MDSLRACILLLLIGLVYSLDCKRCIYIEADNAEFQAEIDEDFKDSLDGEYSIDCINNPSSSSLPDDVCVGDEECMTATGTGSRSKIGYPKSWIQGITVRGCYAPTISKPCEETTDGDSADTDFLGMVTDKFGGYNIDDQTDRPMGRVCACDNNDNCHTSDNYAPLTSCYICRYLQVGEDELMESQIKIDEYMDEHHTPQCKDDVMGSDVTYNGCRYNETCVSATGILPLNFIGVERRSYEYILRGCVNPKHRTFSSTCSDDTDNVDAAREMLYDFHDDIKINADDESQLGIGHSVTTRLCSCPGYRCNSEKKELSAAGEMKSTVALVAAAALATLFW